MLINLIAQSAQAAIQLAPKLKGNTLEISAAQLAKVLPQTKVFGEKATVVQLYRDSKGKVRGSTLRIWEENGQPVLLDAALQPLQADIKFKSWQAKGYNGSVIVEAQGQEFVVELALNLDAPTDPIGSEGAPKVSLLKKRPIRAVAFKALETGVPYTVIERENGFCTIETENGESERYYLSGRLAKLIDQEGGVLPFNFEIVGWEPVEVAGATHQAPIVQKAESANFSAIL